MSSPGRYCPCPVPGFLLLCDVGIEGTIKQDQSFCHKVNKRSPATGESEGVPVGDGALKKLLGNCRADALNRPEPLYSQKQDLHRKLSPIPKDMLLMICLFRVVVYGNILQKLLY